MRALSIATNGYRGTLSPQLSIATKGYRAEEWGGPYFFGKEVSKRIFDRTTEIRLFIETVRKRIFKRTVDA